jgi:hypothetical protein
MLTHRTRKTEDKPESSKIEFPIWEYIGYKILTQFLRHPSILLVLLGMSMLGNILIMSFLMSSSEVPSNSAFWKPFPPRAHSLDDSLEINRKPPSKFRTNASFFSNKEPGPLIAQGARCHGMLKSRQIHARNTDNNWSFWSRKLACESSIMTVQVWDAVANRLSSERLPRSYMELLSADAARSSDQDVIAIVLYASLQKAEGHRLVLRSFLRTIDQDFRCACEKN